MYYKLIVCGKVPLLGAVVQYVDVDGHSEPHEGIIVKHIDDKCDSILVDKKSHCRRLVCITTHTHVILLNQGLVYAYAIGQWLII